jgi:hypothetical protein
MDTETSSETRTRKSYRQPPSFKWSYVVGLVVAVIVLAVVTTTLQNHNTTKNDIASGKIATDSFLAEIRKQDAATAYKFGNSNFKSKYTEKELANLFKSLSPLIKANPSVVKQTLSTGTSSKTVSIYYKFSNPTYYFVVAVTKPKNANTWELLNFSGSPTQADLYKTQ